MQEEIMELQADEKKKEEKELKSMKERQSTFDQLQDDVSYKGYMFDKNHHICYILYIFNMDHTIVYFYN